MIIFLVCLDSNCNSSTMRVVEISFCYPIIYAFLFLNAGGYIFHPNYTERYTGSGYFGYSVLMQRNGSDLGVMVGAPNEDKIYYCSRKHSNCLMYDTGVDSNNELRGATIAGGEEFCNPVIVCGPKYLNKYRANGRCYIITLDGKKDVNPLQNGRLQIKNINGTNEYFYANGQAGFSIKYVKANNEFILGAPGYLSWKGTIIRNHVSSAVPFVLRSDFKVNKYSYLGYSVEYGLFAFHNSTRQLYIAGAPRASSNKGEVILFRYDEFFLAHIFKILGSEQIGSYFGATLLVVSRNDYRLSDLIIGAPMYAIKTYDEGCVFVYNSNLHDIILSEKLCGTQIGGRFGSALSTLGDLNNDMMEDIAIAAPYEDDGRGAVYIYMGSSNGYIKGERIAAKSIDDNIRGFGFSLSNAINISYNSNKNFAVGAYKSGHVVILKSRTVLQFSGNIKTDIEKIQITTTKFTIYYCMMYELVGFNGDVNTELDVDVGDNAKIVSDTVRNHTMNINTNYCQNMTILLKQRAFDSPIPIRIKITSILTECADCAVAYPRENVLTKQIPFVTGCGQDDICYPKLNIKAVFKNKTFVIGSKDPVILTVNIENVGDPAYLCKLNISIPTDLGKMPPICTKNDDNVNCDIANYIGTNKHKSINFEVDMANVNIQMKEMKVYLVSECTGEGSGKITKTNITLPLKLSSNIIFTSISVPDNLYFVKERPLITFVQEYILYNKGPSPLFDYKIVFNIPHNFSNTNGKYMNIFYIDSGFDECIDEETMPEKVLNRQTRAARFLEHTNPDSPTSVIPTYRKYILNCSDKYVHCKKYVCSGRELKANDLMKVTFNITGYADFLIDLYAKELTGQDIIILESNSVLENNENYTASTRMLLYREVEKQEVNIWIWLLSVVGAVVILAAIIYSLHRVKFFSRPIREKLKNEDDEKDSLQSSELPDSIHE